MRNGPASPFLTPRSIFLPIRVSRKLPCATLPTGIVANFVLPPTDHVNPLPILLGAVADGEARIIALRLLHDRIFLSFRDWFGSDEAEVRAARLMIVSTGFFTYRDQLPLPPFLGAVEPGLRSWLEAEFQALVDG